MLSAARVLGRKAFECSNLKCDISGARRFSQLLNGVSTFQYSGIALRNRFSHIDIGIFLE